MKNLQLDWSQKEDVLAAIRLAVKKELRGKVPFSELDRLLKEVIEQAEAHSTVIGRWCGKRILRTDVASLLITFCQFMTKSNFFFQIS